MRTTSGSTSSMTRATRTQVPTGTTYGSIDTGVGSQSGIYFLRYDGATGRRPTPVLIDAQASGHQLFPDISAGGGGNLHAIWWDSRNDPTYSPARPVGNDATGNTVAVARRLRRSSTDSGSSWTASDEAHDDEMSNPQLRAVLQPDHPIRRRLPAGSPRQAPRRSACGPTGGIPSRDPIRGRSRRTRTTAAPTSCSAGRSTRRRAGAGTPAHMTAAWTRTSTAPPRRRSATEGSTPTRGSAPPALSSFDDEVRGQVRRGRIGRLQTPPACRRGSSRRPGSAASFGWPG